MNTTQIPIDNINICFVGGVSTSKSTVLNVKILVFSHDSMSIETYYKQAHKIFIINE